ncbi:unnamed protein product [Mytilus coruscus]|uniref:Uncharacterized protein n=1 Tax=Mytilus coruscus TaxID=42192 RepID=A0A6J8B735_MYTCO|nr:unnamed protein product [Mytilus coruscus]
MEFINNKVLQGISFIYCMLYLKVASTSKNFGKKRKRDEGEIREVVKSRRQLEKELFDGMSQRKEEIVVTGVEVPPLPEDIETQIKNVFSCIRFEGDTWTLCKHFSAPRHTILENSLIRGLEMSMINDVGRNAMAKLVETLLHRNEETKQLINVMNVGGGATSNPSNWLTKYCIDYEQPDEAHHKSSPSSPEKRSSPIKTRSTNDVHGNPRAITSGDSSSETDVYDHKHTFVPDVVVEKISEEKERYRRFLIVEPRAVPEVEVPPCSICACFMFDTIVKPIWARDRAPVFTENLDDTSIDELLNKLEDIDPQNTNNVTVNNVVNDYVNIIRNAAEQANMFVKINDKNV